VTNEHGVVVLASASTDGYPAANAQWEAGRRVQRCTVDAHLLRPGRYYVSVSEPSPRGDVIHDRIIGFRVSDVGSLVARDGRVGVVTPLLRWTRTT
jgi:hypothetical protein